MRVIQCVGELDGAAQYVSAAGSGPAQQPLGERLTFEVFHHEEPDRLAPAPEDAGSAASPTSCSAQMCA